MTSRVNYSALEKNARILVTGGAGFIGSHLVEDLLRRGMQVNVIDNLSSGKLKNLPQQNESFQFFEGDVSDFELVKQAMEGCSAVVHLAAVASVQASVEQPRGTHQSNLVGTLSVCDAMLSRGIKRIVFASSASVYGSNGMDKPIPELTQKDPMTPYAIDKLASEQYLVFYRSTHEIEPVILRFFNIYGPRQDPSSPYSGVISIFCDRALKKLPITIYGDGEQTRDFVFVTDLVSILMTGLLTDNPPQDPVNIGMGKKTSLNQIIYELENILDIKIDKTYSTVRPGDIRHSLADCTRLVQLGWSSETLTINAGLSSLIDSLQQ